MSGSYQGAGFAGILRVISVKEVGVSREKRPTSFSSLCLQISGMDIKNKTLLQVTCAHLFSPHLRDTLKCAQTHTHGSLNPKDNLTQGIYFSE